MPFIRNAHITLEFLGNVLYTLILLRMLAWQYSDKEYFLFCGYPLEPSF